MAFNFLYNTHSSANTGAEDAGTKQNIQTPMSCDYFISISCRSRPLRFPPPKAIASSAYPLARPNWDLLDSSGGRATIGEAGRYQQCCTANGYTLSFSRTLP